MNPTDGRFISGSPTIKPLPDPDTVKKATPGGIIQDHQDNTRTKSIVVPQRISPHIDVPKYITPHLNRRIVYRIPLHRKSLSRMLLFNTLDQHYKTRITFIVPQCNFPRFHVPKYTPRTLMNRKGIIPHTLHRNSLSSVFLPACMYSFFRNFETVAERKKRKRVNNMRKDKIQRSRDRKANENKF